MSHPFINCRVCKGSGKTALPPGLRASHKVLAAAKKPMKIVEFGGKLGIEVSNAHHRMKRLIKVGLAEVADAGFPKTYRVTR